MTSDIPLLVIPLVAGYAFSTIWNASFYQASRERGHRLYFRAVFYALFLLVVCAFLHVTLIGYQAAWYAAYAALVNSMFSDTSLTDVMDLASVRNVVIVSTLPVGLALAGILNLSHVKWIRKLRLPFTMLYPFVWWEQTLIWNAVRHIDFERLIARSFFNKTPLLATLYSGKIYAGWVVAAPNPGIERRALRLLPILSGYREPETQVIQFTTDYVNVLSEVHRKGTGVLDHLDVDDLEVVIPADQISSAHLFDLDAYAHFHADDAAVASENGSNTRDDT